MHYIEGEESTDTLSSSWEGPVGIWCWGTPSADELRWVYSSPTRPMHSSLRMWVDNGECSTQQESQETQHNILKVSHKPGGNTAQQHEAMTKE